MVKELGDVRGMEHVSFLGEVQGRLLIVVTNNSNYNAKELLRQWVSDKPKTRNLKRYNPVRLNTGALLLDDTEYTRECCKWLRTLYLDDVVVTRFEPLFRDDVLL